VVEPPAADAEGKDQGTLALFDVNARRRVLEGVVMSAGPGSWADGPFRRRCGLSHRRALAALFASYRF